MFGIDDFALQYGEHGVTAAESTDTDFSESEEEVSVDIHDRLRYEVVAINI